uniref:hypothetical protein n=1 Tax=Dysosmobacter welbionis TaxID=2093857 RepID=UPI00307A7ACE
MSSGHCPFFSAFSKWTQATAWYCIPLLSRLISKEISRVSCAFKELDGIWNIKFYFYLSIRNIVCH